MNVYHILNLKNEYDQTELKIGALLQRLQSDLDSYKEKLQNPTSGQLIHIELRQQTIDSIESFLDLSKAMIESMTERIYEVQNENDSKALKQRVHYLEQRLKKAEMVLQRGFNYDTSLLNYQRENDFI